MSNVKEWSHREDEGIEKWGAGPWDSEPDKIQWVDDATGLDCLMHRNRMGSWCGYVGVAEGHPLFEKQYDQCEADVHGGLTYSDFCQDTDDESKGVCHVPLEGRPHRVWWLGFDCAHYNDATPAYTSQRYKTMFAGLPIDERNTYRDRAYVEQEVTQLAAQIAVALPVLADNYKDVE